MIENNNNRSVQNEQFSQKDKEAETTNDAGNANDEKMSEDRSTASSATGEKKNVEQEEEKDEHTTSSQASDNSSDEQSTSSEKPTQEDTGTDEPQLSEKKPVGEQDASEVNENIDQATSRNKDSVSAVAEGMTEPKNASKEEVKSEDKTTEGNKNIGQKDKKEEQHSTSISEERLSDDETTAKDDTVQEDTGTDEPKLSEKKPAGKQDASEVNKDIEPLLQGRTEKSSEDAAEEKAEQKTTDKEKSGEVEEEDTPSEKQTETGRQKEQFREVEKVKEEKPEIPEAKEGDGAKTEEAKKEPEKKEEKEEEPVNFSALSKAELIEELRRIINEKPIQEVKDEVDQIRFHFIKKHKAEVDKMRKNFLDQGGLPQDFKPEEDPQEKQLKGYIEQFREKRSAFNREQEESKHKNLEEKYRIIEEIKDLINRKESLNKTFQEFRELQNRWREVGLVPQASVKDLWETYHHHVEKFYDYIKINKELRDLDLKKNLEAKIRLCEKAEELLLEPNIINAFKTLQTYHDQWREIGPVPSETRAEIWERFKEATSKINRKHQEYYDNLKQEQKHNLESKQLLCEKAEEITEQDISSYREWDQRSDEMKELQKVWKTIGFAPRKDNNKIYDRFRAACDTFFNKKREFYAKNREEQANNLQRKTDLCIQAEALKDSSEWKKTTDDLIDLQKRWKKIGPVPKKHSDVIWKRFRAACDEFFNRKAKYFENIDSKYEDNLKLKEQLIADIEKFELSNDVQKNLNQLKEFQRRWAGIGFVPIKQKDEIQHRYREAINKKFDKLKIDETEKNIIKFKTKLDDLSSKPKSDYRLRQDREKFLNRLKQLENDIVLWENNIGFFAKSKNADQMINEVENKIKGAREKMEELQQKIDLIDTKLDE